jgi:hypothetical protein
MSTFEEFWIGKGINYKELWDNYLGGVSYQEKFKKSTMHLLRIEFSSPYKYMPLFNIEAVYKTIKGCFHDLKLANLTSEEYYDAAPIFLYRIGRGSSQWDWLGELRQLLTLGTTLTDAQTIGKHLDNIEQKMRILRSFPALDEAGVNALLKAKTPDEIDEAISHLVALGIKQVQVSKEPFTGEISKTEQTLITLLPPPNADSGPRKKT